MEQVEVSLKKFSVARLKQQLELKMEALNMAWSSLGEARTMTWSELGRDAGVNKGLLSRINTGKAHSISAATLLALMAWAGLRVEDVMEDDGDES